MLSMTAPDRRKWIHVPEGNAEDIWAVLSEVVYRVKPRWRNELQCNGVFLRMTWVNQNWCCLDGWIWDGMRVPDQGAEPSEADIPAGYFEPVTDDPSNPRSG